MEAELAMLAASGATTLVGLMVSESWTQARERLTRFLTRRRAGEGAEDELQASSEELGRARAAGEEGAAAEVEAQWRRRLLDVLQEDQGAAAELRELLAELEPLVPRTVVAGGVHHGPGFQGAHIHGGITFTVPSAPPEGPAARPDQVPALTVRFSNRTAELGLLDEALGAAGPVRGRAPVGVGVLDGLPGVGKSAMARRWADTARELFPDGQLYVDFAGLRGRSNGADVSEALAMLLRSLRVKDDCIPPSLAERTALYRSHSADRRLLLVLDDVSQPAQVRALIPKGPGSAVLATSQRRLGELALDGARLIPLKPLDAAGGLALLADRLGDAAVAAEPAAATRLVALCGGLPVALQIVAARLLVDDGLTMADLVEELADETRRLTGMALPDTWPEGGHQDPEGGHQDEEHSVSAVLDSSYRLLAPEAARLYRLLGWLPTGTFDAGVAAAAARLDTASAKRLLGTLVTACLLERTRENRYRVHDLVRLHARERATREEEPGEERAVTERVATHYLVLAALADRALRRDRLRIADLSTLLSDAADPFAAADGPSPLEWLDAERFAILAVLRAGARHGLHHLVWPLAEAFTVLFLHRRYLTAWKESLDLGAQAAAAAAAAARTAEEVAQAAQAEARLRSLLSRPLTDLGELGRAEAELQTAAARSEVTDHLVLRASVNEFLGRYLDHVDPERAVTAYRASLDLNTRAGEDRGAAIAAYFLGCALDARGDHAHALETLRGAREDLLNRPEPDRRMAARVLVAIGNALAHQGETEEAVRALQDAAQTLHDIEATHYEAQALVALADIAERAGDREEELRAWLSRALEIHEKGGSREADGLRRRLADLDG
ncbi:ATP-binding protein [Streptomyces sp. G45]|uniref:ATP-binding protein n=1 Tax=Streptomyces sp. G45 TaxID=3406627 RepID=UPI003C1A9EAB